VDERLLSIGLDIIKDVLEKVSGVEEQGKATM
jgi:hypothetical protein